MLHHLAESNSSESETLTPSLNQQLIPQVRKQVRKYNRLKYFDEDGLVFFRTKASNGNRQSLFVMALACTYEASREKDEIKREKLLRNAASFYELAAIQQHKQATLNLAACYSVGSGVPKNHEMMLFLFKRANQISYHHDSDDCVKEEESPPKTSIKIPMENSDPHSPVSASHKSPASEKHVRFYSSTQCSPIHSQTSSKNISMDLPTPTPSPQKSGFFNHVNKSTLKPSHPRPLNLSLSLGG
jgi:hypothetical protein